MAGYQLLKHKGYERSVRTLPQTIRQKALWSQVLLGIRGRTPTVKSTSGFELRWRRTPVQGNHYYMWWIPYSESKIASENQDPRSILIHSIRHHDQNSAPILAGTLADYDELPVSTIDPRFDEQWQVVEMLAGGPDTQQSISVQSTLKRPVVVSTIKGLPGSGKTVSLYYLVRDLVEQIRTSDPNLKDDILYVTYTSRLKRAAQEFLQAQDEEIARRVRVQTLNEIQGEITGINTYAEPFGALTDFYQFLNVQNSATLGPWKRYPQTLYTEVRAHLLGKTFPNHYSISGIKAVPGIKAASGTKDNGKDGTADKMLQSYAKSRKIDEDAADIAFKISERAAASRFFHEQTAAQKALGLVAAESGPKWLKNLNALVVDEVQDLTLIQIAFLGELARAAIQSSPPERYAIPFFFTIAGDESQIVQPTGFDWGVTKDLLSEQLGTYPTEYEFQHQRRSPRLLAQLIDNSWRFYRHLPKTHRPSARSDSFVDASIATEYQYESAGQLLLCSEPSWQPPRPLDANRNTTNQRTIQMGDVRFQGQGALLAHFQPGKGPDWQTLVDELTEKPGRVLIDMTETLRSVLPEHVRTVADDVLFLSREIKGLERATVIIYGLNAAYERARQLSETQNEDNIPRYEARRIFDEIRVALSRSTARLVLLEPADAPVLVELGIDAATNVQNKENSVGGGLLAVGWDDLMETLRTEEMAELEVIEGYLDEVEDLAERNRWEQAYRRNRRAYDLAIRLGDTALERETQEQYIGLHLQDADRLFANERWSDAYKRNRSAHKIAVTHGDPMQLEKVNEQRERLTGHIVTQAQALHSQAQGWAKSHSYKTALQNADDAHKLATAIEEVELVDAIEQTIASICRRWAYLLTDIDKTSASTAAVTNASVTSEAATHAIELLERAAKTVASSQPKYSQLLQTIATRYRETPPVQVADGHTSPVLSKTQTTNILDTTRQYLAQVESAGPAILASQIQSPAQSLAEPARTESEPPKDSTAERPTPQFITDLAARFDADKFDNDESPENADEAARQDVTTATPETSEEKRAQQELYHFPLRWLQETFTQLGNRVELYYLWAATAQRWIQDAGDSGLAYAEFDEHLWDLENRAEMLAEQTPDLHERADKPLARFDAFILGYHGEAAQASAIWEELGEIEFAAEQARNAGEIERAYDLLRHSKAPLPEALTLAAKSIRQLEQLAQNPTTLRPQERRALHERLAQVQQALDEK